MAYAVINTSTDLDAIQGTPEHSQFMAMLSGSIYRLEKDDVAKTWKAIEDTSTVERFGFTKADFLDAVPPALPEYVESPDPVQMQKNAEARAYLASTDWYVVRQTETGAAIPDDVTAKRAEARMAII